MKARSVFEKAFFEKGSPSKKERKFLSYTQRHICFQKKIFPCSWKPSPMSKHETCKIVSYQAIKMTETLFLGSWHWWNCLYFVVVQLLSHIWLFATPNCSTTCFPVLRYLPEFAQTHVSWVGDVIQPSHPLLPPSSPSLILSQHQGLYLWVCSPHQVTKVLELQHQFFQWIFRIDFL